MKVVVEIEWITRWVDNYHTVDTLIPWQNILNSLPPICDPLTLKDMDWKDWIES